MMSFISIPSDPVMTAQSENGSARSWSVDMLLPQKGFHFRIFPSHEEES